MKDSINAVVVGVIFSYVATRIPELSPLQRD
jgi:hypothetical protein